MARAKGLFILEESSLGLIYGPDERADLAALVDFYAPPQTRESIAANPALLDRVELIFSGWGGPVLDKTFLDAAPNLKAVFYGAGTLGYMLTPAVWERGIMLTSALSANAIPVAEYTLATILFSLKHGWRLARQTKQQRRHPDRNDVPGCYGTTVGLVSLGAVGRALLQLLTPFNLRVLAYDPFLDPHEARALGIERATLDEVFRTSDVVSVHTPLFPETAGMITGAHLGSMKSGATFINTARGQIVREAEMIAVLARRPDLQAILDVTTNEPTEPDSQLYDLDNVVLTPHMAGSVGAECRRMGRYMVDELKRYLAGEPLRWAVTPELVARSSHRPVAAAGNRRAPAGAV